MYVSFLSFGAAKFQVDVKKRIWGGLKRTVTLSGDKVNRSTAPKIWSLSVSKSNDKKVIHWALSAMVKFKIRRVQSKAAGV